MLESYKTGFNNEIWNGLSSDPCLNCFSKNGIVTAHESFP